MIYQMDILITFLVLVLLGTSYECLRLKARLLKAEYQLKVARKRLRTTLKVGRYYRYSFRRMLSLWTVQVAENQKFRTVNAALIKNRVIVASTREFAEARRKDGRHE